MATADRKPELLVRQATFEDRDVILDIDEHVYDGADYIGGAYNDFCKDPYRVNFVLEADGLVVSYLCATLVDDCRGVIYQAVRTRPGHRKLGYQTYLKKQATKHLATQYPALREAMVTGGSETSDTTPYCPATGSRRVAVRKVVRYVRLFGKEDISTARKAVQENDANLKDIERRDIEELPEIVKREDFKRFLPEGRLMVSLVPYRLEIESNFTMKYRFPDKMALTWDAEGELGGISFVMTDPHPERNSRTIQVDIYTSDVDILEKHFMNSLQEIVNSDQVQDDVHIFYYLPMWFEKLDFNGMCREKFGLCTDLPEGIAWFRFIPLISDTQYVQNIRNEMEQVQRRLGSLVDADSEEKM